MSKMMTFPIKQVAYGEVFYGTNDTKGIAPALIYIPREYKDQSLATYPNKWITAINTWFTGGLHKDAKLIPKRGIDKEAAIKHIQCLLNCFLLEHLHKIAAGAFLLNQWFEDAYM